ncbi:putative fungal-specific transcription factor, partial [Aureobasidium pullulans]
YLIPVANCFGKTKHFTEAESHTTRDLAIPLLTFPTLFPAKQSKFASDHNGNSKSYERRSRGRVSRMLLNAFNKASVKLIKCPNTVVSDAIHTKSNAMVKSLEKTARWLIARSAIIPSKIERRQLEKGLFYINDLLKEIDRLKQQGSTPQSDHQLQSQSNTPDPSGNTDSGNPLVRDDAWFVPLDESPIFIGEAACTAFSSRLRQLLLHTQAEIHIARTHYVQDSQIVQAADENAQWPSRPQAYLLVESVIATVGQCYHISSLSSVRAILEKAYTDRASLSQMKQCKLFALFALAQVYSPRLAESQDSHFPGLPYFAKARALLPVLPERATADHVEILICFTIYCLAMNRRHSAYWYIGSAMRLAMTLGLHHNIAESQLPDLAARQMRARLWWTVYALDRFIASKIGHSAFILDDDIEVSPPSDVGLTDAQKGDVCVILATRPTLLQVFHVTNRTNRRDEIPQATFMLAETCVHTARHTCRLLTQAWTALPALDYSSAQYLYAAATILAVANLCVGSNAMADKETFQSAHHLMKQLDRLGNIAAREFCQHLDAVLGCISRFEAEKSEQLLGVTSQELSNMDPLRMDEMTTEMAIFQPNVQDFLSYDNADLEALFPFDTTDIWPYVSMPDFEP